MTIIKCINCGAMRREDKPDAQCVRCNLTVEEAKIVSRWQR